MQIIQIKEDLRTIEKSITMIKKLSGKSDAQSINQLNRWITSKEKHAQNIQTIISQYFLTQRINRAQIIMKMNLSLYISFLSQL